MIGKKQQIKYLRSVPAQQTVMDRYPHEQLSRHNKWVSAWAPGQGADTQTHSQVPVPVKRMDRTRAWRRNTEPDNGNAGVWRHKLSLIPSLSWMFSHSLFPTCSCTAGENTTSGGAGATAWGDQHWECCPGTAGLILGHQKITISGARVSEKGGLHVEELLGAAGRTQLCPWDQALISAMPNPPDGPAPRSPLEAMPLASACNFSSGKM